MWWRPSPDQQVETHLLHQRCQHMGWNQTLPWTCKIIGRKLLRRSQSTHKTTSLVTMSMLAKLPLPSLTMATLAILAQLSSRERTSRTARLACHLHNKIISNNNANIHLSKRARVQLSPWVQFSRRAWQIRHSLPRPKTPSPLKIQEHPSIQSSSFKSWRQSIWYRDSHSLRIGPIPRVQT